MLILLVGLMKRFAIRLAGLAFSGSAFVAAAKVPHDD
jgi:hypothetical protein